MTSFNQFTDRNRDQQDGYERGMWGEIEYVDGAGAVMKVRGTGPEDGTLDEEVPLLNTGFAFNVPKNSNTEVILLSMNSDTNQKYAIATIPRDKQRKWAEGTGGVQHPTNPEIAVQIDNESIWLKNGTFHLGDDRSVKITVSGSDVTIATGGDIDIQCGRLTHNGTNIGDTHVHSQGNDSNGDGEADTDPPH